MCLFLVVILSHFLAAAAAAVGLDLVFLAEIRSVTLALSSICNNHKVLSLFEFYCDSNCLLPFLFFYESSGSTKNYTRDSFDEFGMSVYL